MTGGRSSSADGTAEAVTGTAPSPAAVRAALDEVYDPCSQSWQRPMSLPDLGLLREVTVSRDGHATVRISLTAPFCMAVATIMQATEQRVGQVAGVTAVTVEIDTDTPWSPALMTPAGRAALARSRAADRARPLPPRS